MAGPTSSQPEMPTGTAAAATPSCTTAVPGDNGYVPVDACNSNYNFYPSFAANCAFAVLFGLSFAAHLAQAVAWRKRFCWVLLVGVSWEATAFVVRTLGSRDQQNQGYAIAGQLFFLLAPLWINAFVYMTAARLVHYAVPDQSVLRVRAAWLTQIFVWIDVVCFLVQAAGGVLLSNNSGPGDESDARLAAAGKTVYMAGCGAQLGFIIVFSGLMARVHVKMRAGRGADVDTTRARLLFWVLVAVLVLIVMRIIFRLVEFGPGAGSDNHMLANEGYALGLDAAPMTLAVVLLNAVHPGWVLRGPNGDFPRRTRQERRQARADRKQAKADRKLGRADKDKRLGRTGGEGGVFVELGDEASCSSDGLELGRPQTAQRPVSGCAQERVQAGYEDVGRGQRGA